MVIVRDITGGGNAPVTTRWLAADATEVEIRGGDAFWPIRPSRTYRIIVSQLGLMPNQDAKMIITTPSRRTTSQQNTPQPSSPTNIPEPPITDFIPIWPVRIEQAHYLTGDPWVYRTTRYHPGSGPPAALLGVPA